MCTLLVVLLHLVTYTPSCFIAHEINKSLVLIKLSVTFAVSAACTHSQDGACWRMGRD